MKFLLEQGLPRTTVDELRSIGIAAEHVGDIGLASASDMAILELAKTSGAIIVTLDADFHSLLAISNNSGPSVIRIRIEGLKGEALAHLLSMVSRTVKDELRPRQQLLYRLIVWPFAGYRWSIKVKRMNPPKSMQPVNISRSWV